MAGTNLYSDGYTPKCVELLLTKIRQCSVNDQSKCCSVVSPTFLTSFPAVGVSSSHSTPPCREAIEIAWIPGGALANVTWEVQSASRGPGAAPHMDGVLLHCPLVYPRAHRRYPG